MVTHCTLNTARLGTLILGVFLVFGSSSATALSTAIEVSSGYRVDSLDWNIAADFSGSTPNILSELQWNDLKIYQVGATAKVFQTVNQQLDIVYLGQTTYGLITAGSNQDSDYAGDNRTIEWSRSNNDAGDGHVFDLTGGAGLRFHLPGGRWFLTPQLGYAYSEQDLLMRNGYQTLSVDLSPTFPVPPPVGPFHGLNSSYYAWWYGPWLGLEAEYQLDRRWSGSVLTRWYEVDFQAEADWNLRSDLKHPVSFAHEAEGDGYLVEVGGQYLINERWVAGLNVSYRQMQAQDGIDIVYLADNTVAGTRLNEVNWTSRAFSISLQYRF